ncbi:hypothetical protein BGZ89_009468 [Linnemannia elongata]|nr:hypothetical protein BGZ89_009468 [Linnemannia elongata]
MSGSGAPIYAAKSTIRSLKNFSKGYTDIQGKVRTATSNDPWGPSGSQMNELAHATFNQQAFLEIMEILDKRMNDKGKNWRHVFKALTVLDYLLHVGSENVVRYARDNLYIVKTLKEFQFIDEDGKDQGSNVRQKAKDITALLTDEARLKEERRTRSAMHDRMSGRAPGEGRNNYNATTPTYERPGAGDDDRDLQRALEESRRMARESQGDNSDDDELKKALALSKKEEQDRAKKVEQYNEFSMTEDWEADANAKKQQENSNNNNNNNNTDFFGNDFGGQGQMGFDNNNNNNNNGFNNNNFNDNFIQSQPTGFNNPYLQFQQQQLQEQQMQQQMLMQQQFQQQQLLQQQQQAFMNQMNNPYQQQLMPQMTGAPSIGSNNPFSANNIQKAAANQPFPDSFKTGINGNNNSFGGNNNGFGGNNNGFGNNNNGFGSNGFGSSNNNNNNSSSLGDLAFLQNVMNPAAPAAPTPAAPAVPAVPAVPVTKAPNAHDEKYAHLAFALSNREDGMDTFGNTGQLRLPSHHTASAPVALGGQITGASNPFQRSNIGGMAGNQNNNNPFQGANGFVASNPTGFGGVNGNSNGAYSNNTLF